MRTVWLAQGYWAFIRFFSRAVLTPPLTHTHTPRNEDDKKTKDIGKTFPGDFLTQAPLGNVILDHACLEKVIGVGVWPEPYHKPKKGAQTRRVPLTGENEKKYWFIFVGKLEK